MVKKKSNSPSKKTTCKTKAPARKPKPTARKAKSKPKKPLTFFSKVKFVLNVTIWAAVFFSAFLLFFIYDLPEIEQLQQATRSPGISIVSQDGTLIATSGDIYGATVTVDDLPDHVWQSVIAIEDRRFFDHFGIDVLGLMRASYSNYKAGRVVQGGSTLTQQLAKNFFLSENMYTSTDRSLRRKVQEVIFALWLERKFTKKQILSIYLNRVYLGAGVYGIEAAAQKYFNKKAKQMDRYEAAVVAGLLKAPSKYSPSSSPQKAHERARVVLQAMVDAGYITDHIRRVYEESPPSLDVPHRTAKSSRYFVDWVLDQIPNYIGTINQDLLVITTLDPKLQRVVEKQAEASLAEHSKAKNINQVAVVAMRPNGAVKALVGGRHYGSSQYNRATQSKRQAGSVIKPIVYLAALEKGLTPDSIISDQKVCFKGWCPKNYGWKIRGQVALKEGLIYSINTATVRLAQSVGIDRLKKTALKLGIVGDMANDLSIALGSNDASLIDLTSMYATFANGGVGVVPYGILEIRTRSGQVIYRHQPEGTGRVMSQAHAQDMTTMLHSVMGFGTGKRGRTDYYCAGKTGTSQNHKDAWFIGYTDNPYLVAGVWMGNDDNSPMKKVTGGTVPAILWKNIMKMAATH